MYHNNEWSMRVSGPTIVADFQGFQEVINTKQKS